MVRTVPHSDTVFPRLYYNSTRELVSNASDALEKARHRQVAGDVMAAPDVPLQVCVRVRERVSDSVTQQRAWRECVKV